MWFEWDEGEDGIWLGEHGTHGDSPPRDEAEADPKRTLELQRTRVQSISWLHLLAKEQSHLPLSLSFRWSLRSKALW